LLLISAILCTGWNPAAEPDEIIRRKVDNLALTRTLNNTIEIYCIPSLSESYYINEFRPFWSDRAKTTAFLSVLSKCDREGLIPRDYHLDEIREKLGDQSPEERANLDILLTDAFLLYATHLLSGKVDPVRIDAEWHVRKNESNPLKYLYELNAANIDSILTELRPKNPDYIELQHQLQVFRTMALQDRPGPVPAGPMLRPGMTDARISNIRSILEALGYQTLPSTEFPERYDENLRKVVAEFQKNHGLESLGNIGEQTVEMLNLKPEDRIRTIEVNLERIRWLPQEVPNYYLIVNLVNFELDVVLDNKVVRNHRVIVGKEYRKTPVFILKRNIFKR